MLPARGGIFRLSRSHCFLSFINHIYKPIRATCLVPGMARGIKRIESLATRKARIFYAKNLYVWLIRRPSAAVSSSRSSPVREPV